MFKEANSARKMEFRALFGERQVTPEELQQQDKMEKLKYLSFPLSLGDVAVVDNVIVLAEAAKTLQISLDKKIIAFQKESGTPGTSSASSFPNTPTYPATPGTPSTTRAPSIPSNFCTPSTPGTPGTPGTATSTATSTAAAAATSAAMATPGTPVTPTAAAEVEESLALPNSSYDVTFDMLSGYCGPQPGAHTNTKEGAAAGAGGAREAQYLKISKYREIVGLDGEWSFQAPESKGCSIFQVGRCVFSPVN
jgi:hypothetical protein